ncbi:MAG: hypothetical protein ACE148_04265 [Vicinamibacterales bacterium]
MQKTDPTGIAQFELRMRRLRVRTCIERARRAALESSVDEARQRLEEARRLEPRNTEVAEMLAALDSAFPAASAAPTHEAARAAAPDRGEEVRPAAPTVVSPQQSAPPSGSVLPMRIPEASRP